MSVLGGLFKIGASVVGAKKAKKGINNADRIMSDSESRVLGELDAGYNDATGYIRGDYGRAEDFLGSGYSDAEKYITPIADNYGQDEADYRALLARAMDPSRYEGFQRSPGYDFLMEEVGRATERSAAARGGLLSGRAALELQRRGGGIASQEFNTWADRQDRNYGTALSGRRDLLSNGLSARQRLSEMATGRGSALAGLATGRGNALAGISTDRAQSRAGAIGQVATNRSNLALGKGNVNAQMWGNIGSAASDIIGDWNPFKKRAG